MTFNTIINKQELLKVVEDHKNEYVTLLKEAQDGYVQKCTETLKQELKKVTKWTKPDSVRVIITPPEDRTDKYEEVICMLKWTQSENIELTPQQFNNYVRNKWDWYDSFLVNNSVYSSGCMVKLQDYK